MDKQTKEYASPLQLTMSLALQLREFLQGLPEGALADAIPSNPSRDHRAPPRGLVRGVGSGTGTATGPAASDSAPAAAAGGQQSGDQLAESLGKMSLGGGQAGRGGSGGSGGQGGGGQGAGGPQETPRAADTSRPEVQVSDGGGLTAFRTLRTG